MMRAMNQVWSVLLLCVAGILCQNEECITHPSDPSCKNYHLPNVEEDIQKLCSMMSFMPGCTVRNICEKKEFATNYYCGDFSILKDICLDMPGMKPCSNYSSMCAPGTIVEQCQTRALPIPTTSAASEEIFEMCSQMRMESCSKCQLANNKATNCDLLTVYSELCLSMPDMKECATWKEFCMQIPDWPICSSKYNRDLPPEMRMYFHLGIVDYVLFRDWVPRTTGQYVGAWIACFLISLLYEFIKMCRSRTEKYWAYLLNQRKVEEQLLEESALIYAPFRKEVDIPRAFFHFIEVGWGFLVMLIAMTFNVGLFLAICFGAAFGALLFGRFNHYEPKPSCH